MSWDNAGANSNRALCSQTIMLDVLQQDAVQADGEGQNIGQASDATKQCCGTCALTSITEHHRPLQLWEIPS